MADPAINLPDIPTPPAAPGVPSADVGTLGSDDSKTITAITGKLANIDKEKISATERAEKALDSNIASVNTIAKDQLHATALMAEQLKPWDAKQKTEEFRTDPIAAFGSLGSVLGILASAFTKAPMENALNASAAAMNAIHAGDKEAYERAHTAWTDNTSLALKRFGLEQEGYKTAIELMATNRQAGTERLRLEMAKYGWDQGLVMHEAGLDDKVFEAIAARDKARMGMAANMPKMVNDIAWVADWHRFGGDSKNPQSEKSVEALRLTNERWGTGSKQTDAQKLLAEYSTTPKEDGSYPNNAERTKKYEEIMAATRKGGNAEIDSRAHSYEIDPDSPTYQDHAASYDRALKEIGEAKRKPLSATETAIAKKVSEEEKTLGRKLTSAEYDKVVADAPKPQTVKSFSTPETARLTYTPTLMKSLQTLDAMMDDSTGLFTGPMKQFAAEYIGVNDPVKLWQSARKEAEAAVTALAAQGSKSAISLKALIDTLPETPRSSSFGHQQVADKMKALLDETQTALSTMEAGGKRIPEDVMDKFAKYGITTKTDADKNPVAKLDKDPASLSTDELKNLAGFKSGYPKDVQDKITAEIKRRAIEWEKNNRVQ